jgi:hypothetical protein
VGLKNAKSPRRFVAALRIFLIRRMCVMQSSVQLASLNLLLNRAVSGLFEMAGDATTPN